jgi:hypothetical protein
MFEDSEKKRKNQPAVEWVLSWIAPEMIERKVAIGMRLSLALARKIAVAMKFGLVGSLTH